MTGYQSKKTAARDKVEQWDNEALKLALEVLEDMPGFRADIDNAITAIKEALAQPAQELWCMKMNGCTTKCDDCPDEAAQPAQPAQEPDVVMHWDSHTWTTNNPPPKGSGDVNLYYIPAPQRKWVGSGDLEDSNAYQTLPAAQPAQERNFCSRCGKRTADLTTIHTCTPPQENT